MTDTYGPFDGTPWSQDQWYRQAAAWAPSGVIDVPAASAATGGFGITFSGLTPTLALGRAWVRGAGYEISGTPKTLTAVPANTGASLSRRDRIVLRRDLAAKTVTPVLIQGTPASSPAPPALTQVETGQWDTPLFSFLVPPSSGTSISGITDERVFIDPDGGARHQQRQWYVGRTGNDFDDLPATTMTTLVAFTITNAPAGEYDIHSREVISAQNSGAGFQQITVNNNSVDPTLGTSQPRADIIVGGSGGSQGPRHVFAQSAGYTHPGGDMTVRSLYQGSSAVGTPRVHSQGTELTVKYLGVR